MSFITDLFSGGASKLVDSIGGTLDKVITTKSEKMQLENEMKKAEMDYQLELQKLSVEERRMMYEDLGSARHREEVVQQSATASKLGKNIASYLAIAATILCFAMFYIMVFRKSMLDDGDRQIVVYILGVLSALLTQVYSYYFGSSAGSAAKSKTIDEALSKK
ncbi:MAG: hypothetical protein ABIT08_01390 [Bacteroidia bacterium]